MIIMNIDRIVKRSDFANTKGLKVTSIFRTIQGEGPFAGYPAVFNRLAGCNFGDKSDHCQFCDTSFELEKSTEYSLEELEAKVTSIEGYRETDILVITGGEPTLQENLFNFLHQIKFKFYKLQIETNGTQAYFFKLLEERPVSRLVTVVSPKASHRASGYTPLSDTVLRNAHALKFVLSADPSSIHHKVPGWAFAYKDQQVYVSPMAVYQHPYQGEVSSIWDADLIDTEATKANYAYAAKYAMDNHCLLSLQTHLFVAVP